MSKEVHSHMSSERTSGTSAGMRDRIREELRDEFDAFDDFREVRLRRLPSPGIAAVLAVLVPGLGHVYAGRLLMGAIWFLAISFGYWAILVPGLLLHAISVWTAYRSAERVEA